LPIGFVPLLTSGCPSSAATLSRRSLFWLHRLFSVEREGQREARTVVAGDGDLGFQPVGQEVARAACHPKRLRPMPPSGSSGLARSSAAARHASWPALLGPRANVLHLAQAKPIGAPTDRNQHARSKGRGVRRNRTIARRKVMAERGAARRAGAARRRTRNPRSGPAVKSWRDIPPRKLSTSADPSEDRLRPHRDGADTPGRWLPLAGTAKRRGDPGRE